MSIVAERGRSGARIAPLWRNRDYLRWFTGDLLGDLGSSLRGFAMPLVTLAVGGTATASGLIGTSGRIAYVVGLLPGGVIADRTDRKRLIVTGHVLRALVFGAVALAWWAGLLGIGGLVAAAVCSGAMSGLFGLASDSAIKHVVSDEQLPSAAAANQARSSVVELTASPLAGLLMTVSPALPFAAETVGHAVGAVCVARIETDMSPAGPRAGRAADGAAAADGADEEGRRSAWSDLRRGWRLLIGNPVLLTLVVVCSLGSMELTGFNLALVLSWRLQGVSPARIGLLLTLAGAAMLVGAALAPALTSRLSGGTVLIGAEALHAVLLAACALATSPAHQAVLFACAGGVLPVWNSVASGYTMHLIPSRDMGRALSAVQVVNMALPILGPVLAGWGLDRAGAVPALLGFVAVNALTLALLAARPGIRALGGPREWGGGPDA